MAYPAMNLQGLLTVEVNEVRDLKRKDTFTKMGPYVILRMGGGNNEYFKTNIQHDAGSNATFNQTFMFNLRGTEDVLHVEAMDHHGLTSDSAIGVVDIPLSALHFNTTQWYQLKSVHNHVNPEGEIRLTTRFEGQGLPDSYSPMPMNTFPQQQPMYNAPPQQPIYNAPPQQFYNPPPQQFYNPPVQQQLQQDAILQAEIGAENREIRREEREIRREEEHHHHHREY